MIQLAKELVRKVAPFVLLTIGGAFVTVGSGKEGWEQVTAYIFAALIYLWALDIVAERAKAEGERVGSERVVSLLCNGNDTEISITVNHVMKDQA